MGTIGTLVGVSTVSVALCLSYSALDLKFGAEGFLCWSAFTALAAFLAGGPVYAAVSLAFLVGGKTAALEPLAVLAVSFLASHSIISHAFRRKVDDTLVEQRPFEQEIRDILFRMDPSRLHLVDAELDRYMGREKQLLRKIEQEQREWEDQERRRRRSSFASASSSVGTTSPTTGDGDGMKTTPSRRAPRVSTPRSSASSAVQQAHEEETRRVQEAIRQRVESLSARVASRR